VEAIFFLWRIASFSLSRARKGRKAGIGTVVFLLRGRGQPIGEAA
jgi:hypothetical protein